MEEKYLYFNEFERIPIDESYNIPTVVYYDGNQAYIGYDAYDKAANPIMVNNKFKIDVGRYDKSTTTKNYLTYTTADGNKSSAMRITELFLNKLLSGVNQYFTDNVIPFPKHVVIAEPLKLQINDESTNTDSMDDNDVDEKWLSTYRKNLKDYFNNKGFEKVSFLPEPFAVFQYYKYCKKFYPLNDHTKLLFMVIDFGGGTFDTCIIETSEKGMIKTKGKNSKPLGASSLAKGGSDIDKEILNSLLYRHNKNKDIEIKRGIRLFRDVHKGKVKYDNLTDVQKFFINNYHKALIKIEEFKIKLSNYIRNWDIDADISESISISLPDDFFRPDSEVIDYRLSGVLFREIFEKFYDNNLKKGIQLTLERGLNSTKKKQVDYILLSGGSSMIGWISEFIKRDFGHKFINPIPVKLKNYKEVVSSGLAVDCARQYYSESGDFADTTYNTINLVLNPNNRGIEIPNYKGVTIKSTEPVPDGVLIPSATNLRRYFGEKLQWRFKLRSESKHELKYYFLRNSLDQNSIDNLQNVLNTSLNVSTKRFDKHLFLELELSEDGMAKPKFVFNNKREEDSFVFGKSFFLDMTYGDQIESTQAYLGIDFGTCNSSVSYISSNHIEIYNEVEESCNADRLKELINLAPFPIANSLARFHKESDIEKRAKRFMEYFESLLALVLYTLLVEIKSKGITTTFEFTKYMRAAGSIVSSLKILLPLDQKFHFIKDTERIFSRDNINELDEIVKLINEYKHNNARWLKDDYTQINKILYDIYNNIFKDFTFGFFERIEPEDFSDELKGEFRVAHGHGCFTDKIFCKVESSYSKLHCFLIDSQDNTILDLFPLIFRQPCKEHPDHEDGHIYLFDRIDVKGCISYTASDINCKKLISPQDKDYGIFKKALDNFFTNNKNLFSIRLLNE